MSKLNEAFFAVWLLCYPLFFIAAIGLDTDQRWLPVVIATGAYMILYGELGVRR